MLGDNHSDTDSIEALDMILHCLVSIPIGSLVVPFWDYLIGF